MNVSAPAVPLRVLVVEDHPVVRQGLEHMAGGTEGFAVCAATGDRDAVLPLVRQHRPDLVLLDLLLDNHHALDLIRSLLAERRDLRVLVISMLDESVYAERALRAGAIGYIMKSADTAEIQLALRNVAEGRVYLSPRIFVALFRGLLKRSDQAGSTAISDRELQVYQMIGAGLPNRDIATQLGVSVKTIEAHRENIKSKLGLADARELSASAQAYIAMMRPDPTNAT